jgi:hypothetical protein
MSPIDTQFIIGTHNNQLRECNADDDDVPVGDPVGGVQLKDEDPAEIEYQERTKEDILHGYLPDSSYDPANMEDDGEYPQELNWSYSDVLPDTPNTEYSIIMVRALALGDRSTGSSKRCSMHVEQQEVSVISW